MNKDSMFTCLGEVSGKTLKLDMDPELPDGKKVRVHIEVMDDHLVERLERLRSLFGVWKDDEEMKRIFDEIAAERARDFGREVNFDISFDDQDNPQSEIRNPQ